MIEFVDTHCHLNDAAFDTDREDARRRAVAAGVTRMVCIGADRAGSERAVAMASPAAGLAAAIGIHPEAADQWAPETQTALARLFAESRSVVAYGEIGLDYHWDTVPQERQQRIFAEQILFAASLSPALPLVIHCRDAQEDVLRILRESGTKAPTIMHCFTGDSAAARAALDEGCFLGIGGVITFKNSEALRAAVAEIPIDRILLETDCPYLAPLPWRGRRNEPSYLPAIAEVVATVKKLSLDTVARQTTENALRLFPF